MVLNIVDLSNNNGRRSINSFPADGYIMKATEGTYFVDRDCDYYVQQAKRAGKLWGFYHFIGQYGFDPVSEANFFVKQTKNYFGHGSVWLDYEGSTANSPTRALQFINRVHQLTGIWPGIYMSESVVLSQNWAAVARLSALWVASYSHAPSIRYWKGATLWQHTSSPYDKSYFYGDRTTWAKLAGGKASVSAAAPKRARKPVAKAPTSGARWVKETKTYTLRTAVNLRTAPSASASVIAVLPSGAQVKSDQAIIQGGYRWVRQPRAGADGYLATGPANNTLEYVSNGSVAATHTYYTVKSGDSWWAIANRYGVNMNTLAAKNGKSISSVIHPGDKLIIK